MCWIGSPGDVFAGLVLQGTCLLDWFSRWCFHTPSSLGAGFVLQTTHSSSLGESSLIREANLVNESDYGSDNVVM